MKDTRREEGVRQTGETGRANAITEGVIWKQLLLFFFPILFGTFFQQLYNTVDAIIIVLVIILLFFALKGSLKHFKGESPCCGGGSGNSGKAKTKFLDGPVIGKKNAYN